MQYFFLSPLGCRHALSAVSIKSATVLSKITRQLVTEVKKNNTGAMLDCCLAPVFSVQLGTMHDLKKQNK